MEESPPSPKKARSRPSRVALKRASLNASQQADVERTTLASRGSVPAVASQNGSRLGSANPAPESRGTLVEGEPLPGPDFPEAHAMATGGGLVNGRLLELFLTTARQPFEEGKPAEGMLRPEELEQLQEWLFSDGFRKRFANGAKEALHMHVLCLAAREQLSQAVYEELARHWSEIRKPPEERETEADFIEAKATGQGRRRTNFRVSDIEHRLGETVAEAHSKGKPKTAEAKQDAVGQWLALRKHAQVLLQWRKDTKALQREVNKLQEKGVSQKGPHELLAKEFPEAVTGVGADFWKRYSQDARKKLLPTEKGIEQQDGRSSHFATTRSLTNLRLNASLKKSPSGQGPPSRSGSDLGSLELPTINNSGRFVTMVAAASGWELDRHAQAARRLQAAKFTESRRKAGTALPSIVHAMQPAAAAADRSMGQLLRHHANEPGFVRPGSRGASTVLRKSHASRQPPVLGFAETYAAPCRRLEDESDFLADIAAERYIQICHQKGLVPTPNALEMARQRCLASKNGEVCTNADFVAFVAMIPLLDRLDSVNLSGCHGVQLDQQVLMSLLEKMQRQPVATSLRELNLSGCLSGRDSLIAVMGLLQSKHGPRGLLQLDLAGIAVPSQFVQDLAEAIGAHPNLKHVSIANTHLGLDQNSPKAILQLFSAPRLETLDLSWNSLTVDSFQALGVGVNGCPTLQQLSIAGCSGCRTPLGESPCTVFLENMVGGAPALRILDLTANLLDSSGTLVLEDALEQHKKLEKLILSENTLGSPGTSSILRLLCRDSCGLQSIDCTDCVSVGEEHGGTDGGKTGEPGNGRNFNVANPCGRYVLDLERTSDRAALRQLYKACHRLKLSPEKSLLDQDFSEGTLSHPTAPGPGGLWPVPTSGRLIATFSINEALPALAPPPKKPAKGELSSEVGLADRFLKASLGRGIFRFCPSAQKVPLLLAKWASAANGEDVSEQLLLLDALSRGFQLDFPLLKMLISTAHASSEEVLRSLIHNACLEKPQRLLAMNLIEGVDAFVRTVKGCAKILDLDIENPTGRYKLELANPCDYAAAETLLALDRWESAVAQKEGRGDCSVEGDWCNFRNCFHGGTALRKVPEWHICDWGTLSFDYVTWRRPPPDAKAMALPAHFWQRLLATLTQDTPLAMPGFGSNRSGDDSKLEKVLSAGSVLAQTRYLSLRAAAGQGGLFLRSWQLRELLHIFKPLSTGAAPRLECLAFFYVRLVDPENSKLIRAKIDEAEVEDLRKRIGVMTCMPFYQPEDYNFHFDLNIHEDRLAVSHFCRLAYKERIENVKQLNLVFQDGKTYDFEFGLPKGWEDDKGQPTEGKLTFRYVCSPECVQLGLRKDISRTAVGWRTDVKATEVLYWKALTELPAHVLDFLYTCMHKFSDPAKLWQKLNAKGHGNLSLAEFNSGLEKLGWSKYVEDPDLAKQVFRSLDPDTNGEISDKEWLSLRLMGKELQLSALEFLHHMERHYRGDFQLAFRDLDDNDDGCIERSEWEAAAKRSEFYGPSLPIFNLAACSDGIGNSLSMSDWTGLCAMWEDRVKIRKDILGE